MIRYDDESVSDPIEVKNAKRIKKIRKFYKQVFSWVGTSIFLIVLDLVLSGGVSWSKYPVFFWGLALFMQFIQIILIQKVGRTWEEKFIGKMTGEPIIEKKIVTNRSEHPSREPDYSEELLQNKREPEEEQVTLSDYRHVKNPWKEEDLV